MPKVKLKGPNGKKKNVRVLANWAQEEMSRVETMHKTKTDSIAAAVALNDATEIMSRRIGLPIKKLIKQTHEVADANLKWLKKNIKVEKKAKNLKKTIKKSKPVKRKIAKRRPAKRKR